MAVHTVPPASEAHSCVSLCVLLKSVRFSSRRSGDLRVRLIISSESPAGANVPVCFDSITSGAVFMLFKCEGREQDHAEIGVTGWLTRLHAPILKREQRSGDLGKGYRDCGIPADMLSGLAYRRGRRYLRLHRGGERILARSHVNSQELTETAFNEKGERGGNAGKCSAGRESSLAVMEFRKRGRNLSHS